MSSKLQLTLITYKAAQFITPKALYLETIFSLRWNENVGFSRIERAEIVLKRLMAPHSLILILPSIGYLFLIQHYFILFLTYSEK